MDVDRLLGQAIQQIVAEFERLNARVAELEAALRPFAEYCAVLENRHPDHMMVGHYFPPRLTVGDCRRAAAVLKGE